jgi:3-dehydroquinate dehydratase-2
MVYLGKREPEIYGTTTAAELDSMLQEHAKAKDYTLDVFYTNIEGEAINRIYQAADGGVDGLIMNPAGFNYSGYAKRLHQGCGPALRGSAYDQYPEARYPECPG